MEFIKFKDLSKELQQELQIEEQNKMYAPLQLTPVMYENKICYYLKTNKRFTLAFPSYKEGEIVWYSNTVNSSFYYGESTYELVDREIDIITNGFKYYKENNVTMISVESLLDINPNDL